MNELRSDDERQDGSACDTYGAQDGQLEQVWKYLIPLAESLQVFRLFLCRAVRSPDPVGELASQANKVVKLVELIITNKYGILEGI